MSAGKTCVASAGKTSVVSAAKTSVVSADRRSAVFQDFFWSWLQTQQMSCLQTQHMSCLQTTQVSCGRIRPTSNDVCSKHAKMCFSPCGSVWNFEEWVLLRMSLGLAVRTCWSDLEKHPKSASGQILRGWVNILAWGPFVPKHGPEKDGFVEE